MPPVRAHPVYHPRVKTKPYGCSASLRSLDTGWCVKARPAPEGTRSRRCGRRLTGIHGTLAPAHGRQEGDVGTASATPAEQATVPPHLKSGKWLSLSNLAKTLVTTACSIACK